MWLHSRGCLQALLRRVPHQQERSGPKVATAAAVGTRPCATNNRPASQALTCQAFCQPERLLQAVPRRGCRVHHEQIGMPLLLGRSRRSCCECGLLAVQSTQGGRRSCPAGAAASFKQRAQPQHLVREHAEGQCSAGDWRPLWGRRRRQAAALWGGGGDASGGACQLRKLPSVRAHTQSDARQRSVFGLSLSKSPGGFRQLCTIAMNYVGQE